MDTKTKTTERRAVVALKRETAKEGAEGSKGPARRPTPPPKSNEVGKREKTSPRTTPKREAAASATVAPKTTNAQTASTAQTRARTGASTTTKAPTTPPPAGTKPTEEGDRTRVSITPGKEGKKTTPPPSPAQRPAAKETAQPEKVEAKEPQTSWQTVQRKERKSGAPKAAPQTSRKRPLEAIRSTAAVTIKELRTHCLRPESKVSKESGSKILEHAEVLHGLVQELLLRNSFLEGKIDAMAKGAAVQATATKKTTMAGKEKQPPSKRNPATTYAEAVQLDSRRVPQKAIKPPRNVVKIFPSKGKEDSKSTREAVLSIIKPAEAKIRIKVVRPIHSGGIAIETERKEDLKIFHENTKFRKAGLTAKEPKKRNPKIIIYGVPKDMEKPQVERAIWRQNLVDLDQKEMSAGLKLRFRTGPRGTEKDTANWVAEVAPEMRKRLKEAARVYVDWSSCRVQDFVAVTRCFKCQRFGHMSKHCKAPHDTCGHCAQSGHTYSACKSKDQAPACANCKAGGSKCGHRTQDRACPAYLAALEREVQNTNYG